MKKKYSLFRQCLTMTPKTDRNWVWWPTRWEQVSYGPLPTSVGTRFPDPSRRVGEPGSTLLYYISLLSGCGNPDNQCKDPMDNDKDCRVGQLTKFCPSISFCSFLLYSFTCHWPGWSFAEEDLRRSKTSLSPEINASTFDLICPKSIY